MRIPLAVDITSRDGTLNKDSRIKNGMVEGTSAENSYVRSRIGTDLFATLGSGEAQLATEFNGEPVFVVGDIVGVNNVGSYASGASWVVGATGSGLPNGAFDSYWYEASTDTVYATIMVNYATTCYKSTDYVTWTSVGTIHANTGSLRGTGTICKFGNKLYYFTSTLSAVGSNPANNSEIYSSSNDGVTWVLDGTSHSYANRYAPKLVVQGSYLYLIGGYAQYNIELYDVWRSTDTSNWTQMAATYGVSATPSAVMSDGSTLYALDAAGKRYVSANNGATWTTTNTTSFSPVSGVDAFLYNNRIWAWERGSTGCDLKYLPHSSSAWVTANAALPFKTTYKLMFFNGTTLAITNAFGDTSAPKYTAEIDSSSGEIIPITPTTAGLQFSAQSNGANAQSLLFIKNAEQAWTLDTDSALTAITDLNYPGNYTVSVNSLTRTGSVVTCVTAYATNFQIGNLVTIAGATPTDYNGDHVITGTTAANSLSVLSITRVSTTATVNTVEAHGLVTGQQVTISGAEQPEYNGVKTITYIDADSFSFTVSITSGTDSPVTPATGTPILASEGSYSFPYTGPGLSCTYSASSPSNEVTITFPDGASLVTSYSEILITFTGGELAGTRLVTNIHYSLDGSSQPVSVTGKISSLAGVSGGSYIVGTMTAIAPTIASIQKSTSNTATVTLVPNTGVFGSNVQRNITGCDQPDYNGAYFLNGDGLLYRTINYVSVSESPVSPATGTIELTTFGAFTYSITGTPTTPATGTITALSGRDTVPGVVYLDGSFYVMDVYGVVYGSDLNEPNIWNALNFITAQNESGVGKCLAKSLNYVIAFKEWSTEFFYNAGNAEGSPLSRVDNGFTLIGCASGESVTALDGTLFWVAQVRQNGRSVYVMQGTEQQKISTPDVDRILNRDDLSGIRAYGVKIGGHALYVLTLLDSAITLVYDMASKLWHEWTSNTLNVSAISVSSVTQTGGVVTVTTATAHGLSDGDPCYLSGATPSAYNGVKQARVLTATTFNFDVDSATVSPATGTITLQTYDESYFNIAHATYSQNRNLGIHKTTGVVYEMSDLFSTDDGSPIDLTVRSNELDDGSTTYKNMGKIEVVGNKINSTALIRWTDDDYVSYSTFRPVDLDAPRSQIRRCGNYRRRAIELRHINDAVVQLSSLEI